MEQLNQNVLDSENAFIPEIEKILSEIDALRLDGVTKIEGLKNEISNLKRNHQLDPETREKLIANDKKQIAAATAVKEQNKEQLYVKVTDAINFIEESYKPLIAADKAAGKEKIAAAKIEYQQKLATYLEERNASLAELKEKFENEPLPEDRSADEQKRRRLQLKEVDSIYHQKCNDALVAFNDVKDAAKESNHALYLNKYAFMERANNKKLPIKYAYEQKFENYSYVFNLKDFFLKNGLYLTILVLMIVATIVYAIQTKDFLFNWDNILLILNQVSPKIFLALGVGGLIVLAGTDLSIGRLVGMASVFTGMLVTTTGETGITFFGKSPNFTALPLGVRVVFAFLLSIFACCLISGTAGFFTAKFKMHPFISTLATQLFTFGIMAGITGNSFTGAPDPTVTAIVSGKGLGSGDFPIMIIWAAIGIAIMWFIWNKTKFGKNMFAVGGNAEAAAVSGINVFKVTMMVFILAGIYYGIGGSMYGIYTGNVRAQTGQGMEADAIAACVVGGVSFSGGVGKISGIVIGALIFQAIVVVLPMVGITDANFQLAIKGVIILAAVTLDCVKYLKKK